MAQISLPRTEKVVKTAISTKTRLHFIDHLRTALAVLVVLHHVALVYGASTPFYYMEFPVNDPTAFWVLLIFVLLNQGWFMGAFFLLSGYFTPGSYDRKGAGAFLKDKLVRLGIPLLVFYFVLNPLALLGLWQMPAVLGGIEAPLTWEMFWQVYPELVGMGPLWFVAMLLIFNVGYVGWRLLLGRRETAIQPSAPSYLQIGLFVLALAGVTYLMRLVVPIGREVWGFPTLAYLPQYFSFFVVGIVAARRDWLRTISGGKGAVGFGLALTALIVLFPLAFSGRFFSLELSEALESAMGGTQWQAAVYVLWDSSFAVGLLLGLVVLFRRFVSGSRRNGRFLARHSYAVYVIHIPLIVLLAVALKGVVLAPLSKTAVLALITVPICFVVAWGLRLLPPVRRVL